MKIPCFPNWKTSWHFDDKIKQYYLLRLHGFPIIDSYIFWEKDEALKWIESAQMPVIFKLKRGAGSNNVILVENKSNAKRLIKKMFGKGIKSGRISDKNSLQQRYSTPYRKLRHLGGDLLRGVRGEYEPLFWQVDKNYVLFQKFLPNNSFDTRVSIIGERAFAFRRFNRKNDFRASGSGNIDYDKDEVDKRAIQIAFRISERLNFQSMSYDFLVNEKKELEICEISYTYVDYAVYDCPGFWDKDLSWHEGHFWPQYCQLMDALGLPHLKQPH
jgi:glutathione synthase/RimK-type ligase-like ATP-grasp enzyme